MSLDDLVEEVDIKLLDITDDMPQVSLLQAFNDLMRMRPQPQFTLARKTLEQKKTAFAKQPALYDYLLAAFALYVEKNPENALRHRRKRYRKRYGSHDQRGQLRNRVSINERPAEVETRERLGDWEGDTVHGLGGNLVTLVDRKSGYLGASPVKRRTRRQVTRAINVQLKGHVAHTLTLDNGKEFAGHERIALRAVVTCISPPRIRPASAVQMKIPTACSASIFPSVATSAS